MADSVLGGTIIDDEGSLATAGQKKRRAPEDRLARGSKIVPGRDGPGLCVRAHSHSLFDLGGSSFSLSAGIFGACTLLL